MQHGALPSAGGHASPPFEGPGLRARVVPFAIVAAVAEASLLLPPGPQSWRAVIVSAVLLLAVAAAFALPWARLPAWMPVLVPLAYTGSVLALILAAGTASGVGVVILIPLIWTALFHRPWESFCIVAAIVTVEVIISLTPVLEPGAVIARRILLWACLGALLSVATHGLRDRIRGAQDESERLQRHLRDLTVMEDRDRIAADLQDTVIQRIFAAGLTLDSAASLVTQPEVRERLATAIGELDDAARTVRDAVFGTGHRLQTDGIREQVLALCAGLDPVPDVSFTGPVDGALQAGPRARLVGLLRESLDVLGEHGAPVSIAIAAEGGYCRTVIEAGPMPNGGKASTAGQELTVLRDRATEAGLTIDIRPTPGGTSVAWRMPLS
jgi:signal transduction histidine kinase